MNFKQWVRNVLAVSVVATLVGASLACETTKGAGKDIENAGESIQGAADGAKN